MNHKGNENDDVSCRRPPVVCNKTHDDDHHEGGMTTELGVCDVLLGRGTGPNEHIGNIRYRALVRKVMEEEGRGTDYNRLNSTKKRDLAKEVVASVKAAGGRFMKHALTQEKNGGAGGGTNRFLEVPDNVAIDKVKQGFRHQIKAKSFNIKAIKNRTAFSRTMMMSKVDEQKKEQSQRPSIVMGIANSRKKGTTSTSIIMHRRSNIMLLPDQERRSFLPIDKGEILDSSPSLPMLGSAICQPDPVTEGVAAPSTLVASRPYSTLKSLEQEGEHLNLSLGLLDRFCYHGLSRSTLLYSDRRSWLGPITTIATPNMPLPFLRRSSPSLPPQLPLLRQFSSFTGGTTGLQWDPCILHLLALRLERPNTGSDFAQSARKEE